ncbi:MAG TPA: glucose 1-dehydrogenase [Balneolaceae bacterium]|nr:glucose 1-dehydrogenase [Balneolaceae bacterium]
MKGKIAVVTGAASGIGRATAKLFALHGATVLIADKNLKGLDETLKIIKKSGGKGAIQEVDVTKPDQIEAMVRETIKRFGQLDFACNNAGIEGEQGLTDVNTMENWERVNKINLEGTWLCMKHEIAEMLQNQGGSIVNISSIAGLVGFPGISAYVSSKHGINGLTKTAALEYAEKGIRVNSVCPGVIQTPMIDRFVGENEDERQALVDMHPMKRMGRPEEIAEAVVWLCSEKASFVTGQTLAVDGGFTVR